MKNGYNDKMTPFRVVFCGTPAFALPTLQQLLNTPDIQVVGVLTQPDRPSGRGQKLMPPLVKTLALAYSLPVQQPTRLRKEPEVIAWLKSLQPDFLVTAAFGQILSQEVLDIPRHGTVNIHASLLPQYRGPNPVQWAILNGDSQTGVTTMLTELGVDTGPMLKSATVEIMPDDTAVSLVEKLAIAGGHLIVPTLQGLVNGQINPILQDDTLATHAPKLQKHQADLNWYGDALTLHNQIRGQQPWPGAQTRLGDFVLKVHQSQHPALWNEASRYPSTGNIGEITAIIPSGIVVQTGSGPLLVTQVQPPGKPVMNARDWANGFLKPKTQYVFDSIDTQEVSTCSL